MSQEIKLESRFDFSTVTIKSPERVTHQGQVKEVQEGAAPLCPGPDEVQDSPLFMS